MVYLAGDNNLSQAGERDLLEMRAVGSSPTVNLLAQFDQAGDAGTRRYKIQSVEQGDLVWQIPETDSGDPATLLEFVRWSKVNFPAQNYALILWSHGTGWDQVKINQIAQSVQARNFNSSEAQVRSAGPMGRLFFRKSLKRLLAELDYDERAVCMDDGSGNSLDTIELAQALDQIQAIIGKPLDLLGMDACFMCNLEVAYQIRSSVRVLVASEESTPNQGWPYRAILQQLVDYPGLSAEDLAQICVTEYAQDYRQRLELQSFDLSPVILAALQLECLDPLLSALDDLATRLTGRLPGIANEIWQSQKTSAHFYRNTMWDISHFCRELFRNHLHELPDDDLSNAATAVIEILKPAAHHPVIAAAHFGDKLSKSGGLSIYFLPPILPLSQYYGELRFPQGRPWLGMLKAYHAARNQRV